MMLNKARCYLLFIIHLDDTPATDVSVRNQSLPSCSSAQAVTAASVVSVIITALFTSAVFALIQIVIFIRRDHPDWLNKLRIKQQKEKDETEVHEVGKEFHRILADTPVTERGEDDYVNEDQDGDGRTEQMRDDDYFYRDGRSTVAPSEYDQRYDEYYPYGRDASIPHSEQVYDQIYIEEKNKRGNRQGSIDSEATYRDEYFPKKHHHKKKKKVKK